MSYLLVNADARRIPLPDRSVHVCVTSPPYWGLRSYLPDGHGDKAAEIGLEATPELFVAGMVAVFREVWRVLRDDGTAWVNMGDAYAGSNQTGGEGAETITGGKRNQQESMHSFRRGLGGLKPKDLLGMPWRLAFALQADGWYLRSDIIWAKPNPMPESVTDRPTKSHEYLFLLAKGERYFFDQEAVREPALNTGGNGSGNGQIKMGDARRDPANRVDCPRQEWVGTARNLRSVWTIPTESFPGAHFATYPRKLIEPCIKAGTSERGVCPRCGAPWRRVVERERIRPAAPSGMREIGRWTDSQESDVGGRCVVSIVGWSPGCTCDAGEPVPAMVFDPFCGSGTSLVVAEALGRRGIGLDLSAEYLGMARRRLERPHAAVARPGREERMPLFEGAE